MVRNQNKEEKQVFIASSFPAGSHKGFHFGQALSGCSPGHLWVRWLYIPLTPSGLQVIIKPSLTKPGGLHQPLMISLHFALLFTNNPFFLKLSLILIGACWDPDEHKHHQKVGTIVKSVWHSEPSCVWPQAPSPVSFLHHIHSLQDMQGPTHRASNTCATPAAGQVLTPSHQRLCCSLWTPATHAALWTLFPEWKTNWKTQRSCEPWPIMALPHIIIFHHIPNFHSRIFYLMSPQPIKWCQFVCGCSCF